MAAHTRKTKNGQPDGSIAPVRLLFAECFSLRAATGSVSSGERIEAFRTIPGAVPAFTRRFPAPTIRRGAHSSFLPIRFGCVRRCAAERYVYKRMTWERLTHPALTQLRVPPRLFGRAVERVPLPGFRYGGAPHPRAGPPGPVLLPGVAPYALVLPAGSPGRKGRIENAPLFHFPRPSPLCGRCPPARSVLLRPQVHGAVRKTVERVRGGGSQPFQGSPLDQRGDRLEANRQDGRLRL